MRTQIPLPPTRPLKIFAIDPQFIKRDGNRTSIDVDYEKLLPGPVGERVAVVDYDGAAGVFYEPVDLEDAAVLMRGGLDHSEADPRFHQQMVYAVAMTTIAHFDRALGRRIRMSQRHRPRLRLLPHAFAGANAYYDPNLHAVLFGYFRADLEEPGSNLPNQIVFTCLSHDIIAHEVTHALIHRLRPHFLDATNVDILAFHEGFSDLVAFFQHFSHASTVRAQIRAIRGDFSASSALTDLAVQFGEASSTGHALRSALRDPSVKLSPQITEPHTRGGILVAAVFDAVKTAYTSESMPLIRLATGGSGVLPAGDLHPELIDELVKVARRVADAVLAMIIRAFDYMPPMDMTFGDFLRAIVSSDMNIAPEDRYGLRAALIEAFRARAIYPEGVLSLAEESLAWPLAKIEQGLPMTPEILAWFNQETINANADVAEQRGDDAARIAAALIPVGEGDVESAAAASFHKFAVEHAVALGLNPDPTIKIAVRGFHRVARVSPSGRVVNEIILRIEQHDKARDKDPELGGLELWGGCTVIASADGRIRYVIGKPLPGDHPQGEAGAARLAAIKDFVNQCDLADPRSAYADPSKDKNRMRARANLRSLHEGMGA